MNNKHNKEVYSNICNTVHSLKRNVKTVEDLEIVLNTLELANVIGDHLKEPTNLGWVGVPVMNIYLKDQVPLRLPSLAIVTVMKNGVKEDVLACSLKRGDVFVSSRNTFEVESVLPSIEMMDIELLPRVKNTIFNNDLGIVCYYNFNI